MDNINLITIIGVAFFGSLGHCIGMCGGIVIAYSSTKIDSNSSKLNQAFFHMAYNIGRVTTYIFLGAIFGLFGRVIALNHLTNGFLYIFAGVVMLFVAFSLQGKIKFLTSLEYTLQNSNWFKQTFIKLLHDKSYFSFYMLGILNGFLPCGFVYFFAITAASSASPFYGALIMAIFGLSTIPSLFSVGFLTGFMKNSKFRDIFMKISIVLIVLYSILTIYKGFEFLTNSNSSLLNCH
ncbi:MAG: sulfite exporter TauE/SafE family protein [Campylobacterales bacterium]|nr:sulfite exporter TauE/SafE family protein [Campylobacterales bacterium]